MIIEHTNKDIKSLLQFISCVKLYCIFKIVYIFVQFIKNVS